MSSCLSRFVEKRDARELSIRRHLLYSRQTWQRIDSEPSQSALPVRRTSQSVATSPQRSAERLPRTTDFPVRRRVAATLGGMSSTYDGLPSPSPRRCNAQRNVFPVRRTSQSVAASPQRSAERLPRTTDFPVRRRVAATLGGTSSPYDGLPSPSPRRRNAQRNPFPVRRTSQSVATSPQRSAERLPSTTDFPVRRRVAATLSGTSSPYDGPPSPSPRRRNAQRRPSPVRRTSQSVAASPQRSAERLPRTTDFPVRRHVAATLSGNPSPYDGLPSPSPRRRNAQRRPSPVRRTSQSVATSPQRSAEPLPRTTDFPVGRHVAATLSGTSSPYDGLPSPSPRRRNARRNVFPVRRTSQSVAACPTLGCARQIAGPLAPRRATQSCGATVWDESCLRPLHTAATDEESVVPRNSKWTTH
jgi:hypothetical protein